MVSEFEFDPHFKPRLRVLSLGGGVQSTTLALMSERGDLPKLDCAIFSDTEGEAEKVYRWIEWLRTQVSFPIHRVSAGNLWASATKVRIAKTTGAAYIETALPVYTQEGLRRGMGQRHCTQDFKIIPIERELRRLLGLKRVRAKMGRLVELWIGISTDESIRMKPSWRGFIRHRWPLIESHMSRTDCKTWMRERHYPEAPRSACTYCPFHDDNEWLDLTLEELADAATKEVELQAAYARSAFTGVPYLHDSRQPFSTVKFVRRDKQEQLSLRLGSFVNECAGMCGV